VNVMALIAKIALGVMIGGLTIALLVTERSWRLAVGLSIVGALIVLVVVAIVAAQ
jgi:hypothetical protein